MKANVAEVFTIYRDASLKIEFRESMAKNSEAKLGGHVAFLDVSPGRLRGHLDVS